MNLKVITLSSLLCVSASFRVLAQDSTDVNAKVVTIDVGGMVNKPGTYNLPDKATITDAIDAAGGIKGNDRGGEGAADLNRVRVKRGQSVSVINVRKIRKHESENFALHCGDMIEIAEFIY